MIFSKQTEGHPGITHMRQCKEPINNKKGTALRNVGNHPKLSVLVQEDQKIGD